MKNNVLKLSAIVSVAALAACATQTVQEAKNQVQDVVMTQTTNPLLTINTNKHGVESFDKITVDHYRSALISGMEKQKKEIEAIVANTEAPTFLNTIAALDQSGKELDRAESTFSPISSSNSTEETRALQSELSPLFSQHSDDINMNEALFKRVKHVYDNVDSASLSHEELKVLEKIYKRFERSGCNLSDADKERLRQLNMEISALQTKFSQYLLYETNNTYVTVDTEAELEGLPQDEISRAAKMWRNYMREHGDSASVAGKQGYMFNMQRASCNPVLQYCKNRELRRKVYEAYCNRGNQDNQYNTKQICNDLIRLRLERAKLMGFENCASQILDTRMAKKPQAVYDLLDQIWTPAVKKANEEIADIKAEMLKDGLDCDPEGWDYRYYCEKARKAKFNFNESEMSEYLEMNNVLKGVFYVANKLYGVTFKNITEEVPAYEPTAQAWEVYDRPEPGQAEGKLLAIFYSDYLPRDGKGAGAWCTSFRGQKYEDGKRVEPIVVNVCSFTPPTADKPALMNCDDVSTMFHEFGHALHSFMRDVHYNAIAGVERDFVELPSQINEHWAFEPEVLAVYAKHYKTGADLPKELLDKYNASANYGQGFATTELIAASLVDMDVHCLTEVPADFDCMKFEEKQLADRNIPRQIKPRYSLTNFKHSMGGGYTAGYYSYTWAEVLDADGFEAFKETGDIFNQEVAEKFRKYVLTPGGIDDGMTMYKRFRGSEPKIDALLRNRGLVE